MSGKVIPKEHLEAFQRWELPSVETPGEPVTADAPDGAEQMRPPTAEEIEAIQKQAYDEAFAQGYQEGMERAQAEARTKLQVQGKRLEELMAALAHPFEQLDQQVEQELVALVIAMVRQFVRREIKSDPGQIVAVVREAMAALPVAARNIAIHLHPEDAAQVREALTVAEGERPWRVVEDLAQTRGGCRVTTETSHVDASLETRLAAVIAAVFGGGRAGDAPAPEPAHGSAPVGP